MADPYRNQRKAVQRIVKRKGMKCYWQPPTKKRASSSEPWKKRSGTLAEGYEVHILFLTHASRTLEGIQQLLPVGIIVGDDYGFMGAVDFKLQVGSKIVDSDTGKVLRKVKSIDTLAPDGKPIFHTIQFDKVAR